jgi:hypothetical protein
MQCWDAGFAAATGGADSGVSDGTGCCALCAGEFSGTCGV